MKTKSDKSIKLDSNKLFGSHWVGNIHQDRAAIMPSVKNEPQHNSGVHEASLTAVRFSGTKPTRMPASKIAPKPVQMPATKIGQDKNTTLLPATKIGQIKYD